MGYRQYKSKVPKATDLSALSLGDLKKIQKAHQAYLIKTQAYEDKYKWVEDRNQWANRQNEESSTRRNLWRQQNLAPLEQEKMGIEQSLRDCRVGFIGGFLGGDHTQYDGATYKRVPGEALSKRHRELIEKIKYVYSAEPTYPYQAFERHPRSPNYEVNLKIGGATLKIN